MKTCLIVILFSQAQQQIFAHVTKRLMKGVTHPHYRSSSRAHSNLSHPSIGLGSSIRIHSPSEESGLHEPRPCTRGSEASSAVLPFGWDDNVSADGDEDEQDIEEIWFAGGHADVGGGWPNKSGETPLSHVPLVWIVSEARKSGLEFDDEKW
jgi:hypothetical protein